MINRLLGVAFAIATACTFQSPAALSGGCTDFSDFDRSPPLPVTGVLSNGQARFRWGTDADRIGEVWWAWNYIGNDHATDSLRADWAAAGIHRGPDRPLPPLAYDCHRYPLPQLPDQPDFAAPILYEGGALLNAAVYRSPPLAEAPRSAAKLRGGVHLATEYFTDDGRRSMVRVDLSIRRVGDGVLLRALVESDGVYVGLSKLGDALGPTQLESLQARKLGVNLRRTSVAELSRRGFDPSWSFPHQRDPSFLFLEFQRPRGRAELFIAGASANAYAEIAYLVLLDAEREPITTAPVLVLLPGPGPDTLSAYDVSSYFGGR